MLFALFSATQKYTGNNAGGDSRQDKSAVYQQPVVAGRRRVQTIALPILDYIVAVVLVEVGRHGVSGTEIANGSAPGISGSIFVVVVLV